MQRGLLHIVPQASSSMAETPLISQREIEHAEDLLVEEWTHLSLEARERAQEDVHCVASNDVIKEEPNFVAKRIQQMKDEIGKKRKKFAYERALFLSPSYVNDQDFSLIFLRSTDFQPRKAADCMMAFFELKLELFGIEKLAKPITLDALSEEDIDTLKSGAAQFLPEKDRGGRAVYCGLCKARAGITRLRASFYQVMAALEEDVEMQKRGVVIVMYRYHFDGHQSVDRLLTSLNLINALPWKPMAIHYCSSEEMMMNILQPMKNIVLMMIGPEGRKRYRSHHGSDLEIQFALMSFGIPMKNFPFDDDCRVNNLKDFLEKRKTIEAEKSRVKQGAITMILAPEKLDVLLGRGRPIQDWVGNVWYSSIIEATIERHHEAVRRRGAKNEICDEIVEIIKGSGGRFLKRKEGGLEWVEVDDALARKKVSHAFRNQKQSSKASSRPITQAYGGGGTKRDTWESLFGEGEIDTYNNSVAKRAKPVTIRLDQTKPPPT